MAKDLKMLIRLAVLGLRAIYFFFKLFFKTRKKIVFLSRQSNTAPIDFSLLDDALRQSGYDGERVIIAKKIPDSIIGKIGYVFNIFLQLYHIATSQWIVIDGYSIAVCVLKHKKEVKVIQLWHALSAIKKFGYQSIGTKAGSDESIAEIMCMHKNYDFVLAPSEITAGYYKQAFNISQEQIKYLGLPRIDYILKDNPQKKEEIFKRYPELKQKTNIIYIPTFRKNSGIEIENLVEKLDNSKYKLIIKLHPSDTKTAKPKKDGVIYDSEFEVYDLVKVSDRIITDYSSLAMEVSLLDIPLYFYVYDIEEYEKSPGLNFDFENEEISKYTAKTAEDLLRKIEKNYDFDILKRFREKYISVDTEECSKKIAEFIMNNN